MHLKTSIPSEKYSLLRAISAQTARRELTDTERREHDKIQSVTAEAANGFFVPFSAFGVRSDLSALTNNLGKYTVQTDVSSEIIPVLRNKSVCLRLGVKPMSGLSGNVALPRQTSKTTVESLTENAQGTPSNVTFGQIQLTPKRICTVTVLSKQLITQSNAAIEDFVTNEILLSLAKEIDRQILCGTGQNNEALGVLSTEGVGSVTFGGAPTRDKLIDFEDSVCAANADDLGEMAYIVPSTVRTKWKKTLKIAAGTIPSYLWDDGEWDDGSNDGCVNGYRACSTNQLTDGKVIFGALSQAYLGFWGAGADVTIDHWTLADRNQVKVTTNWLFDCAIRNPAAFAISTDSGAQT